MRDSPGERSIPGRLEIFSAGAGAYCLFGRFGWHELVYNHINVGVPGSEEISLINPFGPPYREASSARGLQGIEPAMAFAAMTRWMIAKDAGSWSDQGL